MFRSNLKLQAVALAISVGLMLLKFVAYFITNSNAIFTDALESIINVVAGAFALYSLILAAKPVDIDHPYGHGKVEFLSSGLEGFLILIAGVAILAKSAYSFFVPNEISNLETGILLIALSGGVNFIMGFALVKRGSAHHSETMIADGKHLKSDAYSTAGLLIGLAAVYFTKLQWLDSVVAIIFGGIIAITGFRVLRKSISGIMDEADFDLLKKLIVILNASRKKQWIDIHNMRIVKYGSVLHIDCHMTLPWYFSLKESHDEVKAVEDLVSREAERKVELFIHTDPCIPVSCTVCQIIDCKVRQQPFQKKITWDIDTVLRNQKHGMEG